MYEELYSKIKLLSNKHRFKIVKLTQKEQLTITKLSQVLNLSYRKCADYITLLEKEELVEKTKKGREVLIKSKIKLYKNSLQF